ncbi:hypothetical protein Trydic_g4852 [Trypoxylus dichotomus]
MEYKKRRPLKRDCCKDREMDRSKWVHTGVRHRVLNQIGSGEGTTEGVMAVDASRREDRVGIGIVWHGEEGDKQRWEYRMKDGTPIDVAEEAAIWLACRKLQERECGGIIVTDAEGILQTLRRFEPKGRIAQEVHHIIWEQMNRGHPIEDKRGRGRRAGGRCGRKESARQGGPRSDGAMQQEADQGRSLGRGAGEVAEGMGARRERERSIRRNENRRDRQKGLDA